MKLHVSRIGRPWLMVACLVAVCLLPAGAATQLAASSGPTYVSNEYIIGVRPNTSFATVEQQVAQLGGTVVKPVALPDTYLIRLGTSGGRGGGVRAASTATSYSPWVITDFAPNLICSAAVASVTPGDEYWDELWGMKMIHMPQAWAIQKGSASVVVGVIDTGVANHPELADRIVPGYDFIDNDADPNDLHGHGTHVAGTIAAQGDSTGVVGVCWDGVQIMPIRALGADGGGTTDTIVSGLDWAMTHNVDVINMSLVYRYVYDEPRILTKLIQVAQRGIIICAAAGNDSGSVPVPARYDQCIAVSSVGPDETLAYYSCYGPEVDIAAPGGEMFWMDDPNGIKSTWVTWNGGVPDYGYAYEQGTSMACPHVAGAAALLLSAGIPASKVRDRLEAKARPPRVGQLDKERLGAGILDVSSALANGSVRIVKPIKGSTVNPYPDFRISVDGIEVNTVAIYVDYGDATGDGLPDNIQNEVPVLAGASAGGYLNDSGTAIVFNWADISPGVPIDPGFHFVYVTARTTVGDDKVEDWGTFRVSAKIVPAGQHLFAFPYQFAGTNLDGTVSLLKLPSDVLSDAGTSQPLDFRLQTYDRARLIRWSAPQGTYLTYLTGLLDPSENTPRFDDKSWLNPVTKMQLSNGLVQPVPTAGGFLANDAFGKLQFPAGTGFWLVLQKDAVLNNDLTEVDASQGFKIPLYKGWNLIGNPFTHDVPLTGVHLLYQGEIRTLDEDQLKRKPWVEKSFYGYKSGSGYDLVPSDRWLFEPYKGYWVRANYGGISPQETLYMIVQ